VKLHFFKFFFLATVTYTFILSSGEKEVICHILTKTILLLFYGGKVVCVSVRVFYICNSEFYPWLTLCIIIQQIFPLYLCVSEFNWEIMDMSARFVTSWSTKRTSPSGILLFPLPCTGTVWQTGDYEGSLFQNH